MDFQAICARIQPVLQKGTDPASKTDFPHKRTGAAAPLRLR
jgi:hypothetical protein